MSQWEMVNGKSTEVGLSPGQTAGYVAGTYVVRDPSSDISKPYVEATEIQKVTVPTGGFKVTVGGKTYYTNEPPEIGYYKPETGYTSVRRTGMMTPEEVEEQYRYQAAIGIIKTRDNQQTDAAIKKLLERGYKPYVTIEGTTLYTTSPPKKDVIVPKYGKFVQRGERTEPFLGIFTPDKFTDQIEKTSSDISIKIDELNKEVSEKFGLKEGFESYIKEYSAKTERRRTETKEAYKGKTEYTFPKKEGGALEQFMIGAGQELAQKPVTAAGNALFALLVTKGIGGATAKLPILTKGVGAGKLASKINAVNVLGAGLAGMYGISVAERYIEAPNKAKFAGQITASEILPFAAGGYLGTKKLPSIPYKEISRRGEIALLKTVRAGRILQAKTQRDFERFILDESAELIKKRRTYQKLIQVRKPEVAKKAEEVEVIRADIALEKQLRAEAGMGRYPASSTKAKLRYKKVVETLQHPTTRQLPVFINLNIQNAEAILNPVSRVIAIQKEKAIQEPISVQRYKPIQEAKAIQETKTIQIAEAILKSKTEQKNIQKIKAIQKPKLEMPIKKRVPLPMKKFIGEMEALAKQNKKGKWVWDVRNPVPTLEDVIG